MNSVRILSGSSSSPSHLIRRSSRLSLYSSKVKLFINSNDPNWMDRFVDISNHLVFGDFDQSWFEDIYFDLLRDLCDETLPEDFLAHLLALLEMMISFLDTEDKIEQTMGSLLNLIQNFRHSSTKYSRYLQCKFINLLTSIVLYNFDIRHNCDSINNLYRNFIKFLYNNLDFQSCLQCFLQIINEHPNFLDDNIINVETELLNNPQLVGENFFLMMILNYYKHKQNIPQLRQLIQNVRLSPDLNFYHLNTLLYDLICSNQEELSLIALKPFIIKFISSNSLHNIHFSLRLLVKFGFELFSSLEEEFFIKQLVSLSTLPSLPIGFRLMALSFVKTAFIKIYQPPLNSPPLNLMNSLSPFHFDGPDTLEKKLLILNEFSFIITDGEFFNLLLRLHQLSDSTINTNFNRSANSIFRVFHSALQKRPQMEEQIKNFLLENLFTLSHIHYVEKLFSFLPHHRQFGQSFVDNFIAKLMLASKEDDGGRKFSSKIQSYAQYCAFLEFINWFLSIAHHDIRLTEFQIEFLVNFIRINSSNWPQSSIKALSCCTSILYYQRVTPKVKDALLIILEWLKNEHKLNVETSSLAQIYLLALRTLKEEYIKQVFTSDEEEFLIQKIPQSFDQYLGSIVKASNGDSPLIIHRSYHQLSAKNINDHFDCHVHFDVQLDDECSMDKLFCVEILCISKQISHFRQSFHFPIIEKGEKHSIKLTINVDFLSSFFIDMSVKFVDFNGTIYNFEQKQFELVLLQEVFVPIIDHQLNTIEEMFQLKRLTFQTLVCLEISKIEDFYHRFEWIKKFKILSNKNAFLFGLAPNKLIVINVEVINDLVNLFIATDQPEIVPELVWKIFSIKK